ncbi:MAG: hypothetical protein K2N95_15290 [Lachnospiraceae bacterium]|nr:hypothetical protein [Lachnospiraceae bacterium]
MMENWKNRIMENQRVIWLLISIELAVLICLAVFIGMSHNEQVETALSDWESVYIAYNDGWYIDESIIKSYYNGEDIVQEGAETGILYGPYIALEHGNYSVLLAYDCDSSQSCLIHAVSDDGYETVKTTILPADQREIVESIALEKDIDSLQIIPIYNGQGALKISGIQIEKLASDLPKMVFLLVFVMSLILDLYLLFYKYTDKKLLWLLGGITLLASLPLLMKGIYCGPDLPFHLMRIEGLAEEFRGGYIPPKVSSLWLGGYGYPVSVYYGDLLLYAFALLRIAGVSAITVYKLYIVFINAGTTVISYVCFQKIFGRRDIALAASLAYVTAGYRIVDLYTRSAVGEYSAMMFLPVVALAVYRIYAAECGERENYRKNAFLLALGMTGLIGTHILTMEMVVFVLALLCVVLWKKTFRRDTLRVYGLAVLETIVLNLYFIVPFLDYYINVDVNINNSIDNVVQHNQFHGAYIGQYFAFFQSIFGGSDIDLSVRMSLTPGLILMLALAAGIVLWIENRLTKEMKLLTAFSMIMLFMASNLFPWDYLAEHFKLGQLLAQVQYPWRYIGIAIVFLTMLLGSILRFLTTEWDLGQVKKAYLITAGACMFMSCCYVSDYSNGTEPLLYSYDVSSYKAASMGTEEYLRYGTNYHMLSGGINSEDMQEVSMLSREGHAMELYCKAGDTDGFVEVPMLHYKGYRVTDEYGSTYEITDGTNNVIRFSLPAGFSGKVVIDFVEPWYWRAGEMISALAVLYLCAGSVVRRAGTRLSIEKKTTVSSSSK